MPASIAVTSALLRHACEWLNRTPSCLQAAVRQLQQKVAKFKEAKRLQEELMAEERQKLEADARALVAEKKSWKKQKKALERELSQLRGS